MSGCFRQRNAGYRRLLSCQKTGVHAFEIASSNWQSTVTDVPYRFDDGGIETKNNSVFSSLLQEKLKTCYRKKEQAILFLNRRGYASFVMCRNCGKVLLCPHCDSSLTYHVGNVLKCHHCGYRQNNVSVCPSCGSDKIRYVGSGTQKVLEEIERLLPEATVLRVDLDTTKTKADYDAAFEQFHRHQADILVGTQMIAKGLDFLNVTLVGIVNADLALHYPSYDATATAFNLIEQVAGRCGRGKKKAKSSFRRIRRITMSFNFPPSTITRLFIKKKSPSANGRICRLFQRLIAFICLLPIGKWLIRRPNTSYIR